MIESNWEEEEEEEEEVEQVVGWINEVRRVGRRLKHLSQHLPIKLPVILLGSNRRDECGSSTS